MLQDKNSKNQVCTARSQFQSICSISLNIQFTSLIFCLIKCLFMVQLWVFWLMFLMNWSGNNNMTSMKMELLRMKLYGVEIFLFWFFCLMCLVVIDCHSSCVCFVVFRCCCFLFVFVCFDFFLPFLLNLTYSIDLSPSHQFKFKNEEKSWLCSNNSLTFHAQHEQKRNRKLERRHNNKWKKKHKIRIKSHEHTAAQTINNENNENNQQIQ